MGRECDGLHYEEPQKIDLKVKFIPEESCI